MDYETMDSSGAVVVLNGARPAGPRRLPVRTAVVRLSGNYDGFIATMRLNPRRSVVDQLQSGDIQRVSEAVNDLVLDWNYVDEAGDPIPQTVAGIYDLPDDLLADTIAGYFAAMAEATAVPKA